MSEERFLVVATDPISLSALEPLTGDPRFEVLIATGWEPERLQEAMTRAQGLIVRSSTQVTRKLLEASPNLRVVGRAGVGVDNIDLRVATERGIPVINAPEGNTASVAELAISLMLTVARKVVWADRSMQAGDWARSRFSGIELRGKTLSLLGAGRIGAAVANRARAFGMHVIAFDPYVTEDHANELKVERVPLAEALTRGDVISLHVPLTSGTEGMIGRRELRSMKPTAILVNTARGGVVDEKALVEALDAGEIGGAALDVFGTEPLPEQSRLRGAPNLVLTPHLGAATAEGQQLVASEIAQGIREVLLDGDLSRALNAPPIGGEELQALKPLLSLAKKVGRVAAVLGWGGMHRVDVAVAAGADTILRPLSAAVVTGLLSPIVGGHNVNYVNAFHRAESRGITVGADIMPVRPDYAEYLEVVLETERGKVRVCGALLGVQLHPRIVRIDEFPLSIKPEGCLVVLRNSDVPGVIGKVGTLLGAQGLNIAEYMQARTEQGGKALAAITVDAKVGPGVLAALRREVEISDARAVFLGD